MGLVLACNTLHPLPSDVFLGKYSVSVEDILKAVTGLTPVGKLPNWQDAQGNDALLEQHHLVEYHIQRIIKMKGSLEPVLAVTNKGIFDAYDKWEAIYKDPVLVSKMSDILLYWLDINIKYF